MMLTPLVRLQMPKVIMYKTQYTSNFYGICLLRKQCVLFFSYIYNACKYNNISDIMWYVKYCVDVENDPKIYFYLFILISNIIISIQNHPGSWLVLLMYWQCTYYLGQLDLCTAQIF